MGHSALAFQLFLLEYSGSTLILLRNVRQFSVPVMYSRLGRCHMQAKEEPGLRVRKRMIIQVMSLVYSANR